MGNCASGKTKEKGAEEAVRVVEVEVVKEGIKGEKMTKKVLLRRKGADLAR